MGRALGLGAGLQELEVRRHRELDVHEQHMPLGQHKGEVGDAGAVARDCGALEIVDLLLHTGHAQHVFGHAFAPLAASV